MLAIELQERGVIKSICPLMIGATDAEGGSGMRVFNADEQIALVPDAVSAATCAKLDELLQQMGAPPLSRRRTAREVVDTIVAFAGIPVWDFKAVHGRADQPMLAWGLHEECAKRIQKVLQQVESEHDSMAEMGDKSAKIAELDERVRTAKSASERSAAEAESGAMKELLLRLLAGQDRIEHKIDANFLAIQARFDTVDAGTVGLAESLRIATALSESLLMGEHDMPTLIWVSPKLAKGGLWGKLTSNWLTDTMVVYFICPYTMAVVGCGPNGEGYEIERAKGWVTKHAKLISRGMFVVRLGLAAGRVVGVPLPSLSLGDIVPGGVGVATSVQQQISALTDLADKLPGSKLPSTPDCEELCKEASDAQGAWKASGLSKVCLLYTSPSPRDQRGSRMPSSA